MKCELTQLVEELVLQPLLKEPVQIDNNLLGAPIVGENFLKEVIFVLLEKVQRVFGYLDFLCSLEELDRADVDLLQVNRPRSEDLLRNIVSLLVHPTDLHDLTWCEVGEDSR